MALFGAVSLYFFKKKIILLLIVDECVFDADLLYFSSAELYFPGKIGFLRSLRVWLT